MKTAFIDYLLKTTIVISLIFIGYILGLVSNKVMFTTKEVELIDNSGMYDVARVKMDDLLATNYWYHTNSDGLSFAERSMGHASGEVLYKGVCDARNAFRLWEESPTHKAVLDRDYSKLVMLMEEKEDGGCYGVLLVK